MTPEQIQHFEAKLNEEKTLLEKELATVGRKNPENPSDWQPIPADMDVSNADENEVADTIEEFEGNTAILKQLEIRYNEVTRALDKIKSGAYGTCEISGEPIEMDRLEANPGARTSKAHMNDEHSLA